jgi:universal stress protein E
MERLRSILVGVDFTPASVSALAQALRIAQAEGGQVHAVHIIETGVLIELQEAMAPFVRDLPESLLDDARSRWQTFAQDLPGRESVDFQVAVGSPISELTRFIEELKPDLVVAGTHGTSGADGGVGVGTLAAQLVRRIPADILLVREQTGPFKRIVSCIDFSEMSRWGLVAATRIAAMDSAELHILHIYRPPWRQVHWHSPTPQANPDFQKQFSDALLRRLEDFAAPAGAALSRPPVVELYEGASHGTGIAEYAAKIEADLVVLGTRGRSNLRALLLGSTAERLLREIPCSVLAKSTIVPGIAAGEVEPM